MTTAPSEAATSAAHTFDRQKLDALARSNSAALDELQQAERRGEIITMTARDLCAAKPTGC